jgi:hypothetical protein
MQKHKYCGDVTCRYSKWGLCVRPKEQSGLKEFFTRYAGVLFLSPYRLKVIDLDSGEEPYRLKVIDLDSGEESELTAEEFLEYYGV